MRRGPWTALLVDFFSCIVPSRPPSSTHPHPPEEPSRASTFRRNRWNSFRRDDFRSLVFVLRLLPPPSQVDWEYNGWCCNSSSSALSCWELGSISVWACSRRLSTNKFNEMWIPFYGFFSCFLSFLCFWKRWWSIASGWLVKGSLSVSLLDTTY